MGDQSSFTGRRRPRKTRRSVLVADRVARSLISVGGVGTIVAVMGVCVFLVWVAVPLFLPADVSGLEDVEREERGELLHLAVDEYRLLSWVLRPSGEIEVFRVDTGKKRFERQLIEPGELVSASFLIQGEMTALGLADGTVRLAEIGFETRVADADQLPAEVVAALENAEPGAAVDFRDGVVERTPKRQYRVQQLRAELGRETRLADGPVTLVSHVIGPDGPLIAAVVEDRGTGVGDAADAAAEPVHRLFLIAGEEQSNFLTGETTLDFAAPVEIRYDSRQPGPPSHLAMTGAGDTLFLAWENGHLLRIDCSDLDRPYVAEEGGLLPPGRRLESLDLILGANTLAWGDSEGGVGAGFLVRTEDAAGRGLYDSRRDPRATKLFLRTKQLAAGGGAAAISLGPSARSRLLFTGFADGAVALYNVTSATRLANFRIPSGEPVVEVAMSPKEDGVAVATPTRLFFGDLDPRHPEASLSALFLPVWYEGYEEPRHTWQSSSGTDDFEVKLGLMPLIFGTLKATVYSMLFGAPLALLAALYTSEFLHRRVKAVVKPGIELMASLPSVVLGFLAALVFAPFIEEIVPATLAAFFTVPVTFLLGAYLWQLLPVGLSVRYQSWRFAAMALTLPVGLLLALLVGPIFEALFFAGDVKAWLAWDPGDEAAAYASSVGGWMLMWLPLSALLVSLFLGRYVDPRFRQRAARWDRRQYALADLVKFALSLAATLALALLASYLLDALGFDPRGGYVDTYAQRNALVVGFIMGFAIIPIIYTISEDALQAVPEHLRSASLGAGATHWQTAVRIIIPTAMSGLFSALMIGLGRAVGETMIVLMAAGNTPVMEWNVFEGFRTLSANIAVELPEAVRGSTHYRTLFLAALVLFVMTFLVNTVAEVVRQRFRKRAYQL